VFDGAGVVRGGSLYGLSVAYTGRKLDRESGLYFFRARYHDPRLGRFTTRDPLFYPDGPNAYAGWMGVKGVDPDGLDGGLHEPEACCAGVRYKTKREGCCRGNVYSLDDQCCEAGRVVQKKIIWACSADFTQTGIMPVLIGDLIWPTRHHFYCCGQSMTSCYNATDKPGLGNDGLPLLDASGWTHPDFSPHCRPIKICPSSWELACDNPVHLGDFDYMRNTCASTVFNYCGGLDWYY
jgi:RHS repeat-associated protein